MRLHNTLLSKQAQTWPREHLIKRLRSFNVRLQLQRLTSEPATLSSPGANVVHFSWLNSARAWQHDRSRRKILLPVEYLMPASLGKSSLIFSSLSVYVFFPVNFAMEVRHRVMFFHVCPPRWSGTGQGRGTLAHNTERLFKESNINAHRCLLS